MAYFGTALWLVLWSGLNQSCGLLKVEFGTDFKTILGLILGWLGWPVMA